MPETIERIIATWYSKCAKNIHDGATIGVANMKYALIFRRKNFIIPHEEQ